MSVQATLVTEQVYLHSCITACVSWHHRAASTAVDDPTTFPKNKHTAIFLPADLWIRDASVGAHQFKMRVPSVCVIGAGKSTMVGRAVAESNLHIEELVRGKFFNLALTAKH